MRKTCHQVFGLDHANDKVMPAQHVEPTARGQCKTILAGVDAVGAGVQTSSAKKNLREGCEAALSTNEANRNARSEQIGVHGAREARTEVAEAIRAEIADEREAIVQVVSK